VLHAVAPSGGDPRFEIDPPLAAERLEPPSYRTPPAPAGRASACRSR